MGCPAAYLGFAQERREPAGRAQESGSGSEIFGGHRGRLRPLPLAGAAGLRQGQGPGLDPKPQWQKRKRSGDALRKIDYWVR